MQHIQLLLSLSLVRHRTWLRRGHQYNPMRDKLESHRWGGATECERERRCIFSMCNSYPYGVFCGKQNELSIRLSHMLRTPILTHTHTLWHAHLPTKSRLTGSCRTLFYGSFVVTQRKRDGTIETTQPTHTPMHTACRTIVWVCVCGMRCAWSASRVKEETQAKRPSTIHRTCFV